MNLQLGTAQFGNNYGLTNGQTKTSKRSSYEILDFALSVGINQVDTSPEYGDSFSILAGYTGGALNVTTKIKVKGLSRAEIIDDVKRQVDQIGPIHRIGRVLIHDYMLLNQHERKNILEFGMDQNLVEIGFSIYELWELGEIKQAQTTPIPVQVPINILNQSFLHATNSNEYANIEFIVRSILLQGALDWNSPRNIFRSHSDIERLKALAKLLDFSPLQLAVAFTKSLSVATVLVGFNSLEQIVQFHSVWATISKLDVDFRSFMSADESLIDPRNWKN
jgi:aryl-alcohol dehydrogenase-like predicted oxidoreductase